MRKKEIEERVRLLQYENQILKFKLDFIVRKLNITPPPMFPFPKIEIHSLGCYWSLPTYEELKKKYDEI